MYTTNSPEKTLNNYAKEPEMYYATYPSLQEQRNYLNQGALGLLLVTSLFLIALGIS